MVRPDHAQSNDESLENKFLEPSIAAAIALLSTMPVVGHWVGVPLTAAMVTWQNQNLDRFRTVLSNKLRTLDDSKLDKTFIGSNEFKGLVVQALEAAVKTASENRCNALANALFSSITVPTSSYIGKQSLIRALAQMSDEEMYVLQVL